MTLNRVWIPSPNFSSRGGTKVRLVVVHTAEGSTSYQSLGSYFSSPSSQVSSQVGIDDTPNTVGEYVKRENKPWTQANANPYSTAAELCAFAKWDRATWLTHPNMLTNTSQWISEECAFFGIPRVRLTAAQAQGGSAGVCGHVDLGTMGGNHTDPGASFPWDVVLSGSPTPTPPTPTPSTPGADNMILVDPVTGGTWCIASREGAVYTLGPAPYLGATNNTTANAKKYPCVGIGLRPNNDGYRIILDWGDAGGGKSADGGTRFRGYDYPRNGSQAKQAGSY